MNAQSPTRRAFVLGHPITHSRSPRLHRFWLSHLDIEGSYDPIDMEPNGLPDHFARMRDGGFAGGNVTIPLKEEIAPFCDEIDEAAMRIGAINTLFQRDGRISATNTDHYGFLANLDQTAPGWDDKPADLPRNAVVLGAGGASRAVLYALLQRGFDRISLLNRTLIRAETLADEFGPAIDPLPLSEFAGAAGNARLLVNTSSIGMHGSRFEDLDLTQLPHAALVTDLVYTPIITPLLADAAARGLKTVDGLGMLLHQAVPGFEGWFGRRPEVTEALRQHIEADL